MAMPIKPLPKQGTWTFADLEALPADGNRYEILDGDLIVSPPPVLAHEVIVSRLTSALMQWCSAHTGWITFTGGGVYVSERTWLEPDLMIYREPDSIDTAWRDIAAPALAVEVLSPSTAKFDRTQKRPVYQGKGVGEIWIVDRWLRTIERWTPESTSPVIVRDELTWTPDPALSPLTINLAELFRSKR